jgi:hypothetical protein
LRQVRLYLSFEKASVAITRISHHAAAFANGLITAVAGYPVPIPGLTHNHNIKFSDLRRRDFDDADKLTATSWTRFDWQIWHNFFPPSKNCFRRKDVVARIGGTSFVEINGFYIRIIGARPAAAACRVKASDSANNAPAYIAKRPVNQATLPDG